MIININIPFEIFTRANAIANIISCLISAVLIGADVYMPIYIRNVLGLGGAFTTLTIVVQASVGYEKRGAAAASNSLVRILGQTTGVSVFGGLFNLSILDYFAGIGIRGVEPNSLYSASASECGITAFDIKASINSGLHMVFAAFALLALLSLVLSFTLGSGLKEHSN